MKHHYLLRTVVALFTALAALQAGAVTEVVRGDVNANGICGMDDLTTMINHLVYNTTPPALWLADIDGDGALDLDDLTALINYLVFGEWLWPEPVMPPPPDDAQVFTVNGVSFAMVHVEGGTFMQGDTSYYHDDGPVHQVTLSSYWIGETEVTTELWYAVMGDSSVIESSGLQPAQNLSWDQSQEFITRLNELTGVTFHLPSEAQWEFAARGGNYSHGYRYSGSDNLDQVGWYSGNSLNHGVILPIVKTRMPNELGLYDMSGGAWEFCEDDWSYGQYCFHEPVTDPLWRYWHLNRAMIVVRGGSYNDREYFCMVFHRYAVDHDKKWGGFRLAIWPDSMTQ